MTDNFLEIKVKEELDKIKLREYLKAYHELSSRLIKKAGLEQRIKVNNKIVKLNYIVKKHDLIQINLNRIETQDIVPEDMDVEIVYEDEDILVANKPPYMVVHPTKSHRTGTLANGILNHFKENGEGCIVRLVSRLDRDTSGLIIIAKNQLAHMYLAKEMEKNNIEKIYRAVIHGKLKAKSGVIDLPIGRRTLDSIKREVMKEGQKAITYYKVVEEYENSSLVELRLETGRTHQIRVHLSYLGCPIYGDSLYGKEENEFIQRQALHAYKLKFNHPKNEKRLELQSLIPKDMMKILENIRKY